MAPIEHQTFSPHWHRVGRLRPRLLPHVGVRRDRFRGRRWHVLSDPAGGRHYRLSSAGYDLVARLDGTRSVDDAWRAVVAARRDEAPTQAEALGILAGLHAAGLMAAGPGRDAEAAIRRAHDEKLKRGVGRVAMPLAIRIPIFNPDALITAVEPLLRPLVSRLGLVLFGVLFVVTALRVAPEAGALGGDLRRAIEPEGWALAAVVFVLAKAWHELGHGVICKSLGLRVDPSGDSGRVGEFGIVLIALFPAPYVDTSSSWALPGKWRRAAVGAGGMLFELALACAAANIWLTATPGSTLAAVCVSTVLVAGVTTILFNANPLVRFDGYYILSDLSETPNLMKRATAKLTGLCARLLYRTEPRESGEGGAESAFLYVYGIMAAVYRVVIVFSLSLLIAGRLHGIGIVLALWAIGIWIAMPTWKLLKWLASDAQLRGRRAAAWGLTFAVIAVVLTPLALVPAPDTRRAVGVVESRARTALFVGESGFVEVVDARAGEPVEAGELVLRLRSPELESERAELEAQRLGAEAEARDAATRSEVEAISARRRLELIGTALERIAEREAALTLVAPHDGVLIGADPAELRGRYMKAGSIVAELVDVEEPRVAVELAQGEVDWHFALGVDGYGVRLRPYASPGLVLVGMNIEMTEAAPVTEGGAEPKRVFVMRVDGFERTDGTVAAGPGTPGERVAVRFDLPKRPLLAQWIDRARRVLQGRLTPAADSGMVEVSR